MDLEALPARQVALHGVLQLLDDQSVARGYQKFETLGFPARAVLSHLLDFVIVHVGSLDFSFECLLAFPDGVDLGIQLADLKLLLFDLIVQNRERCRVLIFLFEVIDELQLGSNDPLVRMCADYGDHALEGFAIAGKQLVDSPIIYHAADGCDHPDEIASLDVVMSELDARLIGIRYTYHLSVNTSFCQFGW